MPGISQRSTQSFVQILGLPPSSSLFRDVQRYFPLVMVSLNRWTLFFISSSQQDCELFIGILAALHCTRLKDKIWRSLSSAFSSWVSAPLQHMLLLFILQCSWSQVVISVSMLSLLWVQRVDLMGTTVQSLSRVQLFATPWTEACQASLSIINSRGVHPNPCPLSQWCHPTITFSVPFSSCP